MHRRPHLEQAKLAPWGAHYGPCDGLVRTRSTAEFELLALLPIIHPVLWFRCQVQPKQPLKEEKLPKSSTPPGTPRSVL